MGTVRNLFIQSHNGKLSDPMLTRLSVYPIIEHLRKELLSREVIHCDETPVQVLKEEGKKPQTQSYMWLYRTGNDEKSPVILYDYQPSRNGDHAVTYLKDFNGYVHSDGYSGYYKMSRINVQKI